MIPPRPFPLLSWITMFLAILAGITLAPLMVPVILAAWASTIARPLLDRFARALKGRNRAAAVVVIILVLGLASVSTFLIAAVISGGGELWGLVTTSQGAPSALKALVSPGATESPWQLPKSPQELFDWIEAHGAQIIQLLGGIAGAAVKVVAGAIVFFVGTWSFLVEGPRAWAWAQDHVPLTPAHLQRLGGAFIETGRGLLIGLGLTASCQAAAAIILYLALGIPRALVLGLLTGLAAVIPIAGTAVVWAPLAAGLFLTDHPVKATIIAALGIGVISSMDNFLRPLFSRYGKLDLPVYLLFISVFGGLAAWGPFGVLLGPLVVRLAIEALTLMREDREAAGLVNEHPPAGDD